MNTAQHPINALPNGYRIQEYELGARARVWGGLG